MFHVFISCERTAACSQEKGISLILGRVSEKQLRISSHASGDVMVCHHGFTEQIFETNCEKPLSSPMNFINGAEDTFHALGVLHFLDPYASDCVPPAPWGQSLPIQ